MKLTDGTRCRSVSFIGAGRDISTVTRLEVELRSGLYDLQTRTPWQSGCVHIQHLVMSIKKVSLAIIGGGAAGVATFVAAVRRRAAATIYIIDPRPVGPGIAFSNLDVDVLCNTSVDIMSVVAGTPADFLDYLIANGLPATLDTYAPRKWMGQYLTDRFQHYRSIAVDNGIEVIHLPYQFQSLRRHGHRRHSIRFTDAAIRPLAATDVIFCTGYGASLVPDALKPYKSLPTLIGCPYPEAEMLAKVPGRSQVLVVGSKLSAIDSAILLCREGHQVTLVSPSGELSCARGRFIRQSGFPLDVERLQLIMARWGPRAIERSSTALRQSFVKLVARTLSAYSDRPWKTQFSYASSCEERLREEIAIAERGDSVWEDLVVTLIDAVNEFYVKNKDHRLHSEFKKTIYRYAAGIALPNARKLMHLIEDGKLTVRRGELKEVEVSNGHQALWLIDWGQGLQRYDAVVVAAGFHFPYFVLNDVGELEIDVERQRAKDSVVISDHMAMTHPEWDQMESIWFVGPPAHVRVPLPNGLFVVASIADQVVASMMSFWRDVGSLADPASMCDIP